jgi:hypothetical protein
MSQSRPNHHVPHEPALGESPSSDIPAKYRQRSLTSRRLNRWLWLLIAAMMLSIGLALFGLAMARRNTPAPASSPPAVPS